jgi:tetratricopeptide (TPR) repeat protein
MFIALNEMLQCMQVKELWAAVSTAESPEALSKLNKDTAKLLSQLQDCPRARILRAAAQLRCGAWDGACASAAAAGESTEPRIKLQAWWINCECLYAQGDLDRCARRLESGLDILRRLESAEGEGVGAVVVQQDDDCLPLPASSRVEELARKMKTVLQCKQLGNTAFQQKDYPEAERQYSAALAVREVAAPAFSAVLYSNRAAVHMVCVIDSPCFFSKLSNLNDLSRKCRVFCGEHELSVLYRDTAVGKHV